MIYLIGSSYFKHCFALHLLQVLVQCPLCKVKTLLLILKFRLYSFLTFKFFYPKSKINTSINIYLARVNLKDYSLISVYKALSYKIQFQQLHILYYVVFKVCLFLYSYYTTYFITCQYFFYFFFLVRIAFAL